MTSEDDVPSGSDETVGHELAELLKERLPDGKVGKEQLAHILAEVVTVEVRKFQGPLPPPEILVEYEQAQEGLITLITERSGKEQDFRHEMNRRIQDREDRKLFHLVTKTYIGQVFAFLLAMTAIGGGIWLLATGRKSEGLATIITAVASLAAVFITGKLVDAYVASRRNGNE